MEQKASQHEEHPAAAPAAAAAPVEDGMKHLRVADDELPDVNESLPLHKVQRCRTAVEV